MCQVQMEQVLLSNRTIIIIKEEDMEKKIFNIIDFILYIEYFNLIVSCIITNLLILNNKKLLLTNIS